MEQGNRLGEEVVRVFRGIAGLSDTGAICAKAERVSTPAKHKKGVNSVGITAARVGDAAFLALD